MHERENALKEWLSDTLNIKNYTLNPLTGDASFRRYYRLHIENLTQIVMDAPPDKENIEPFIQISNTLIKKDIHAPQIHAINREKGFLLLSDFGDKLLLNQLQNDTVNAYYQDAINTLFKMQECSITNPRLPTFDKPFMLQEMNLCMEWFFKAYLSLDLTMDEQDMVQSTLEWIASEVAKQPQTFIHRDYHSRNLMLIEKENQELLGVIDFQDAMCGPITYDLVSLLKDCYISWPRNDILKWVGFFHSHSDHAQEYSLSEFTKAFDLCGLQRHLKVLGVFSRLHLRDNKSGYLHDLPLTLNYVLECCALYEPLQPLYQFFIRRVSLP